ncbi:MAG: ComEC/Rec2 family competence protein [Thermoleophilia bacterium]|nr:ComEC/Rec2 family competence protein [Thermoleophilia bacterium]
MTALLARAGPHTALAALCAGLASANVVRAPDRLVTAALAAMLIAATSNVSARRRIPLLAAGLALAGAVWGGARLDALDSSPLSSEVGHAGRARVVVTGPARRSLFALRIPGEVRQFGRRALREPVLLQLPLGRAPPQGTIVEVIGELRAPRGPVGGFDERAYLKRRGMHVVLRASAWRAVGRRGGLAGAADRLRLRVARTIAPGLGGERRAVVAGVVLGEDEGLSRDLADAFRASGLYHLLAVSGQNIVLLGGGVLALVWLLGLPRWLGHLAAIAAILGYVAAVGWQPSVVRAGIAGVLASLAWLAARPRDRWYFFLAGGAVLLAWNPYALLEPGFQLSFGAVAAIFVAVPRLQRRLEGYPLPRGVREALAVSTACGAATAPILLWHFDAVPIYAVVSNLLAFPAVGPLLGLALAAAAVHPLSPSLASVLAALAGWLAAYVAGVAHVIAALPHAQVGTGSALVIAACAGGLALAVHRRRERPLLLAAAILIAAVGIAWRTWPDEPWPPPPRNGLRVTALDVGQGDATLLEVPEGAVLVDEGPPEARVAEQLRRLGIRRLALVVLTHPSRDNIGGAVDVVRDLDVGIVVQPDLPFPNPFGRPALAAARERGIPVAVARAGRVFRVGRLRLSVLWPDGTATPGANPNDHATVLLASYGSVDALLPADAESNVTLRLRPPPVEILKVAHHGSADDNLGELLAATRPRVAIISVGARNDYGHPAASTLAALDAAHGLAVYRTDRHGRVSVDGNGQRLWVRTERE